MQTVKAHGAILPVIGLGTWQLSGETATTAVASALEAGYRHIDTAIGYGNEAEVGEGLRRSGIARDDVFITSKIPPEQIGADDMM
ncbi:MAG: aldo/keto reductase, partial [Rhizobiales bacterium]|nr:aldo/keto reductase [Hyphomicrobiales bacterium]